MSDLGKLRELSERRTCTVCGATFRSDEKGAAMQKFVDHTQVHQPTPAQWTEAYEMIQAGKGKA